MLSLQSVKSQALDTIEFVFKWYPNFEYAGVYAALDQGYFQEKGIYPKFKTIAKADNSYGYIASQPGIYGTGDSKALIERSKGEPIVLITPIFQHSMGSLFVYKDSGIRHPHDLIGKRIISSPTFLPDLRVMMQLEGIDYEVADIDSVWSLDKFTERKADAIVQYTIEKENTKNSENIHMIQPIHYGVDFYGEGVITSEQEVQANPDRVLAVKEAIIQGWRYAYEYPEKIIDIYPKYSEREISRTYLEGQVEPVFKLILPDVIPIGHTNVARIESMVNQMKGAGLIREDFTIDGYLLEDYISETEVDFNRILIWVGIILAIVLMINLALYLINKRLNRQISLQTSRLSSQNQELRKMNSELDNFVYRVSHDLRAPISSSRGLIRLLRVDTPENQDEYINRLDLSLNKLDEFIQDILSYSRNTRSDVSPVSVNFKKMVQEIIDTLTYHTETVDTIIDIKDCDDFLSDEYRVRVILNNLISNSYRYYDESKENPFIRIQIRCNPEEAEILVEDNGIGIEKEYQDKIFEMFFRASREKTGSGLGLYIVKEAVDKLQGTLTVTSEVGQGTQFRVVIPHV